MDFKKLCDKLFIHEDLHDVPLKYVFRVACVVIELISSGECFYTNDFD